MVFAVLVFSFSSACIAGEKAAKAKAVNIIPKPMKMGVYDGSFSINGDTVILVTDDTFETGGYLGQILKPAMGFALRVKRFGGTEQPANSILLKIAADKNLGTEGYDLKVHPEKIVVTSPADAGTFYACQTIRQLLPNQIESKIKVENIKWEVPLVHIVDKPRFKWRGLMLDSASCFLSKQYTKRYIDLLAYHKMNVLHWHFIDNGGWRMQVKKYPQLTEKGAWSKGPDNLEFGGFYSQDDIREIVSYAKSRHVMVVPEIEMPGHSRAVISVFPELSCRGRFTGEKAKSLTTDVFCPGNEQTFKFIEDVLTEVIELFPSEYIHIGGDECPKISWKKCPKCQARIKAEGLKDEDELQSYFIKRVEKFLNSKGRKLIGWDEITQGGL